VRTETQLLGWGALAGALLAIAATVMQSSGQPATLNDADSVVFDDSENLQQKFDAGDLGGSGVDCRTGGAEAPCDLAPGTTIDGAAPIQDADLVYTLTRLRTHSNTLGATDGVCLVDVNNGVAAAGCFDRSDSGSSTANNQYFSVPFMGTGAPTGVGLMCSWGGLTFVPLSAGEAFEVCLVFTHEGRAAGTEMGCIDVSAIGEGGGGCEYTDMGSCHAAFSTAAPQASGTFAYALFSAGGVTPSIVASCAGLATAPGVL
jgi:hypothetical protein